MKRTLTAFGTTLCVMLATTLASAQEEGFGEKGQFIVSADRLMPLFSFSSVSLTELGAPAAGVSKVVTTGQATSMGFFWGGIGAVDIPVAGGAVPVANPFSVPRASDSTTPSSTA